VRQVRLQSTTLENVVSYTAVVTVKNLDGRLRPGMTATVQFETASSDNVLLVPTSALRITPTEEMRQQAGLPPDTAKAIGGRGGMQRQRPAVATHQGMLWVADSAGKVSAIQVRTGVSDGQKTEVIAPELREGMQIVTALGAGAAPAAAQGNSNPLTPQGGGFGGRRF
jgi:HlyD family secretion protein